MLTFKIVLGISKCFFISPAVTEERLQQLASLHNAVARGEYESAKVHMVRAYALTSERSKFIYKKIEANILLREKDYDGALRALKVYFEPNSPEQTKSFGAHPPVQAWYWFLLVQNGELQLAEKVWKLLDQEGLVDPATGERTPLSNLDGPKLARVYAQLRQQHSGFRSPFRSATYHQLLLALSPNSAYVGTYQFAEEFAKWDRAQRVQSGDDFLPFSHIEYEKDTKKPAIIQ